jgi:hypothetical protein
LFLILERLSTSLGAGLYRVKYNSEKRKKYLFPYKQQSPKLKTHQYAIPLKGQIETIEGGRALDRDGLSGRPYDIPTAQPTSGSTAPASQEA